MLVDGDVVIRGYVGNGSVSGELCGVFWCRLRGCGEGSIVSSEML